MAKLTKEERAELEARLAADDADDGDDDEVEFGFPDGGYIRGRYSRVAKAAAARGHRLEPDPEPEPGDGKGQRGGQGGGNVKRFTSGRRTG